MNLRWSSPVIMLLVWLAITLFWWGFAFYPTDTLSPEWIKSAKYACFGTLASGLPDVYGWMILILGPLSLLIATLVVWRTELFREIRLFVRSTGGQVTALMIFAVIVLEAAWVSAEVRIGLAKANLSYFSTDLGVLPAEYPQTNKPSPDFTLVNQEGVTLTKEDFKGKVVYMTFAFAHCQTVCPALIEQTRQAVESIGSDQASMVIVTLDPWRDTPSSLPSIAQRWKLPENSHILSGPTSQVTAVLDGFEIPYERSTKTGDVTHPAITYVLSPEGRIAYTFNNASTIWLIQAYQRLKTQYAGR